MCLFYLSLYGCGQIKQLNDFCVVFVSFHRQRCAAIVASPCDCFKCDRVAMVPVTCSFDCHYHERGEVG